MSVFVLATGTLLADPQRRQGQKASFVTTTLRVADGESGGAFVSLIGFGELADRLAELHQGDAVSVSGRGRLTAWTSAGGEARNGISVTVEQLATLKPKPRPGRQPRRSAPYKPPIRPEGPELPSDGLDDLWRDEAP